MTSAPHSKNLKNGNKMRYDADIDFRVSKADKDALRKLAAQHNLPLSDFIRRAVIDMRIPEPSDHQLVTALYKVNADLARLGNLLKMGIDEGTFTREKMDGLILDIAETRGLVKQTALDIKQARK